MKKVFAIILALVMALALFACGKPENQPVAGQTDIQNDASVSTSNESPESVQSSAAEGSESAGEDVEPIRYKLAYLCSDTVPKDKDSDQKPETRQIFAMQLDPDENGERSSVYEMHAFDEAGKELEVVSYSDGTSNAQVDPDYDSEGNLRVYGVVTELDPESIKLSANGEENDAQDVHVNADRTDIDLTQPVVRMHTIFELDGKLFQVGSIVGGGATETALRTGTSFVPIGCSVDEGLEILSSRTNDMDIVYADGDQKCQMIQLPSGLKESYRISEEDGQICVEYGVETSDGTVLSDEQYDHISELLSNVTLKIGDRVFLEY